MGRKDEKVIPFADLMKICKVSDPKRLSKLVRNRALPQVSHNRPVPFGDAQKIALELAGVHLDWYEWKQKQRDEIAPEGPLVSRVSPEVTERVAEWFGLLASRAPPGWSTNQPLLGIVCSGGFLRGGGNGPFVLPLAAGLNFLIGDRGAGKSTALNLLGALSSSTAEMSGELVESLTALISEREEMPAVHFRRIRKMLRTYGVDQFACYFNREGDGIWCWYGDLDQESQCTLRNERNAGWRAPDVSDAPASPHLQLLRQGEIFRIADETGTQRVLNNLLDVLYPPLQAMRKEMARHMRSLGTQYAKSGLADPAGKPAGEEDPIHEDVEESRLEGLMAIINRWSDDLRAVQEMKDPPGKAEALLDLIEGLLVDVRQLDINLFEEPVAKVMEAGEEGLLAIYAGRIQGLLTDRSEELAELGKSRDSDLRPKTQDLVQILTDRIGILRSFAQIYSQQRNWSPEIESLLKGHGEAITHRVILLETQERHCAEITSRMRADGLQARVFTADVARMVERFRWISDCMRSAGDDWAIVSRAGIKEPAATIRIAAERLDAALAFMKEDLAKVASAGPETDLGPIFTPVSVELLQGSVYRSFDQLSFGQKSSILIQIVLRATASEAIIIDQPEDNLDAAGIIQTIAPTLAAIAGSRQVIVATHSFNLVAGVRDAHLIVMQSRGEFGIVRHAGPLLERASIEALFDVVEGGVVSFERKLEMYTEFAARLRGAIGDMNIADIEGSYRRRTIDGLRNLLQPMVSDRSILDAARHELKNRQPDKLREALQGLRQSVHGEAVSGAAEVVLLERLDNLCTNLDRHVGLLQSAIEEIRMMNTQPRYADVDLFGLLSELRHDVLERQTAGSRRVVIRVDPELKGVIVRVDPGHLRLVFRNILMNSLRATELRASDAQLDDGVLDFEESVSFRQVRRQDGVLRLQIEDNGRGIPESLREKLYLERCTDRRGSNVHGLGGILISKLLELNSSTITVLESSTSGGSRGTTQEVTLPLSTVGVEAAA